MASTFIAAKAATGIQARSDVGLVAAFSTYELTAALVINDVIQMLKVPLGATILDVKLAVDDIDSNGSPVVILAVGDGNVVDRFIKGSTIGQTGGSAVIGSGVTAATAADAFNYTYTADDTIDVKCTTAPATGTTGTITLSVTYLSPGL